MNELVKASPAKIPMVAEACERDPDENSARLISTLHTLGCSVVVKHRLSFPTNPKTGEQNGWRDVVSGADIVLKRGTSVEQAIRAVEASMAPAAAPNIGMWLTELSHITIKKNEDADEGKLTLVAYIKRLVQYPGDIVRQTLQEWSGKWFPTWGDLKEILDARTAARQAILNGLLQKLPNPPKKKADIVSMKRELALLEDKNVPREWAFLDRSEQLERMDARVAELKSEIQELEAQEQ